MVPVIFHRLAQLTDEHPVVVAVRVEEAIDAERHVLACLLIEHFCVPNAVVNSICLGLTRALILEVLDQWLDEIGAPYP